MFNRHPSPSTSYCEHFLHSVTVSSQTVTFYLPGKLLKTENKHFKLTSGSPWNWADSLAPFPPKSKSWISYSSVSSYSAAWPTVPHCRCCHSPPHPPRSSKPWSFLLFMTLTALRNTGEASCGVFPIWTLWSFISKLGLVFWVLRIILQKWGTRGTCLTAWCQE